VGSSGDDAAADGFPGPPGDDSGFCDDGSPDGLSDAGSSDADALVPALSLGVDRHLTLAGGEGGGPKTGHCPSGTFVTRVDSYDDGRHASGIVFYCATPKLVRGDASYSVSLTQMTSGQALEPGNTSTVFGRTDQCILSGLSAMTQTVGQADIYIEGLGHHCGVSTVNLGSDAAPVFDFKGDGDTSYTTWGDGGKRFDLACQSNEVVVGFDVQQGAWLNGIAPICAVLDVVYM
jgi:hypothetical protein